ELLVADVLLDDLRARLVGPGVRDVLRLQGAEVRARGGQRRVRLVQEAADLVGRGLLRDVRTEARRAGRLGRGRLVLTRREQGDGGRGGEGEDGSARHVCLQVGGELCGASRLRGAAALLLSARKRKRPRPPVGALAPFGEDSRSRIVVKVVSRPRIGSRRRVVNGGTPRLSSPMCRGSPFW